MSYFSPCRPLHRARRRVKDPPLSVNGASLCVVNPARRSSSPCQCGSCGRDSPPRAVSTPPPHAGTQQDGLPRNGGIHPWGPVSSPAYPKTPGSSPASFACENSVGTPGVAAETVLGTGCVPPARRIVLFGEPEAGSSRPELAFFGRQPVEPDGSQAVPSPSIQSERKRGNEASESSYVQVQRGQSSGITLPPVSAPTSSGDGSHGHIPVVGVTFPAGSARAKTVPERFAPGTTSPSDTSPDPKSADGAAVGDATLLPGASTGSSVQSAGLSMDNRATNGAGVGLEEWKAPESVGTFSLGSSGKEAGVGRRRRVLRMRVGG